MFVFIVSPTTRSATCLHFAPPWPPMPLWRCWSKFLRVCVVCLALFVVFVVVFCSQLRSNFSVSNNQISKSSIGYLKTVTVRNAEFAKHKPALLAFQLGCHCRKLHLANELWDMLAISFLLPLYMK